MVRTHILWEGRYTLTPVLLHMHRVVWKKDRQTILYGGLPEIWKCVSPTGCWYSHQHFFTHTPKNKDNYKLLRCTFCLKRVSTSFTSLSWNVRSDTLLLPLYVIFLKSASTQHGSCSGSREHNHGSPEHNLGSPGTKSRFSGTQSRFSGNTI